MCKEYIKIVWTIMTDFTHTEIQEILERFAYFLEIYETLNDKTTIDEITVSFKASEFIENTIREFDSGSILPQFMSCLNAWLTQNDRTLFYSDEFYRKSCDHLLLKYLYNKNNVNVAIKLYTSCCEKTRFQRVLETAFKRTALYEPILKYISANKEHIDLIELKSKLIMSQWNFDVSCGRRTKVTSSVKNMLSSYSVNKQLPYLIKIILLAHEDKLKTIICDELHVKMDDRNMLSKEFWYTLVNLSTRELMTMCCAHETFLHKFVSFLLYCGFMMDKKLQNSKIMWVTNAKSICPEITCEHLTQLFMKLVNCSEVIEHNVKLRINECNNDCLFWNEMLDVLF